MTARIAGFALVAVALVGLLVVRGGGDDRRVRVDMTEAAGLREGADVKVGGARVGSVESITLGRGDVVHAELALDGTNVGAGASAAVRANNLLGDKYLDLRPGDLARPRSTIPANRVSAPVELDQILDVLSPDTRVRLSVLLDQAGIAVTGRESDIGKTLAVFGPGLDRVDRLVSELHSDNAALRSALTSADGWAATFARERTPLGRMVDTAAGAVTTVADRRQALRATLARAPGTLTAARAFLADLERTTVPLGPAARALTATAPRLSQTLAAVPAFEKAASPTLRTATSVAPDLTRLATKATPAVRRAVPAVAALRDFSERLDPLTDALDPGLDGLMSLLQGWARAVQTRDGAGHVFRGDFIFGPELLQQALTQFSTPARRKTRKRKDRAKAPATPAPAPKAAPTAAPRVPVVKPLIDQVQQALPAPVRDATKPTQDLLDFLLKP